jgi:hypothetical protein
MYRVRNSSISTTNGYIAHKTPKNSSFNDWKEAYLDILKTMYNRTINYYESRHGKMNCSTSQEMEIFNYFCITVYNSSSKYISPYL